MLALLVRQAARDLMSCFLCASPSCAKRNTKGFWPRRLSCAHIDDEDEGSGRAIRSMPSATELYCARAVRGLASWRALKKSLF